MGDGALWFAGGGVSKSLLRLLVLERMEERDALFDSGLNRGGATGGKIDFAELIRARRGNRIRTKWGRGKSENRDEHAKGQGN